MKRRTLLAGGALVIGGATGAYALDSDVQASVNDTLAGPEPESAETAIREGVNDIRYSQSVPALGEDLLLAQVARAHSVDMAERDFFAHINPDGEDPTDRAGCRAGETLYRGDIGTVESAETGETYDTTTADGIAALVAESWRASRSHFQILIDGQYQNVGIGVHLANGEFYATAVVC